MSKRYWVYILTNPGKSVLYIGVTDNIVRRVYEHKAKLVDGFTKQYNCRIPIYLEQTSSIEDALAREKQLKKWSRVKKEELIAKQNPAWDELDIQ